MITKDQVIEYAQNQIMFAWRSVMKYEKQLSNLDMEEQDASIIQTLIDSEKDKVEIYTLILENLEQ